MIFLSLSCKSRDRLFYVIPHGATLLFISSEVERSVYNNNINIKMCFLIMKRFFFAFLSTIIFMTGCDSLGTGDSDLLTLKSESIIEVVINE